MFEFTGTHTVPGQTAVLQNTENMIWWGGKPDRLITRGQLILSSAVDAGNTPTTILRPGLILGGPNAAEKVKEWSPAAIDGSENVYGILMQEINMLRVGVAADRFGPLVMIAGPLKAGGVLVPGEAANGLSGKANEFLFRSLTTGRFLMDDDIAGAHNNWGAWRQYVTKTAAYQVLAADNNICFNNIGDDGSLALTLPAIADVGPGFRIGIMCCADEEIVLTSSDGNDIYCNNDLAASTVSLSTTTEQIGVMMEAIAISATAWFVIVSGAHPTDATSFAAA